MKVYIGADHAGFRVKEQLKAALKREGHEVIDVGNAALDPQDDYPKYSFAVGEAVVRYRTLGILICGSGQGICIAANKVRGVRAALAHTAEEARVSREHNNTNVLCLPSRIAPNDIEQIVAAFLETPFSSEERHQRRVRQIDEFEARA